MSGYARSAPGRSSRYPIAPSGRTPADRRGIQRAMARKATRCMRCAGHGAYVSARTRERITCPVCQGSGRDPRPGGIR